LAHLGERRTTFAEAYGRCYGEHVGEHIGNTLGTKEKCKKNPPPLETSKEIKQSTLSPCLVLPIGCMKFVFKKEFLTIFGLGYYPLQRTPYLLNPRNVIFGLRDPDLVMR
jgi:hypothetical protein